MAGDGPIINRPETVSRRRLDSEVWCAIDLGTNSFHLVVARVDEHGHFDVLDREKEVVRLGSGAGPLRRLSPEAIERGLAALDRFGRIADSFGAPIAAVGTSALREAANRDEFVRRASDEIGIDVEVVSGVEEARLIHLGVVHSLPLPDERIVLIDIGGGSTELVVAEGAEVLLARSLKLGAIRLTDRFFDAVKLRSKMVAECRTYVRSFLAPAVNDVRRHAPFTAVGSSGTVLTLARVIAAADGRDPNAVTTGDSFTAAELKDAVATILGNKTAQARAAIVGLDERRRDIIPAGAILLEELVDLLEIERVTVSESALREGILVDRAATRPVPGAARRLGESRRRSVMRMAETFHEDLGHMGRATELALQLFDGLEGLHELDGADRDLLEAAGLLHNVGLFISHAAHHRHSYYVIRHTDQLVGFTDREVELIAVISRYHRKSQPKAHHAEFQSLRSADRTRVRLLAGMLRVAIALDRTRRAAVESIAVRPPGADGAAVDLDIVPAGDADVSLERYTAEERLGLLAAALGVEVRLHVVEPQRPG